MYKTILVHIDESARSAQRLLSFAADKGEDLIVMGAYGQSRFSEILLGARTALLSSPIALWMAH